MENIILLKNVWLKMSRITRIKILMGAQTGAKIDKKLRVVLKMITHAHAHDKTAIKIKFKKKNAKHYFSVYTH